jgi:hypothetical protein
MKSKYAGKVLSVLVLVSGLSSCAKENYLYYEPVHPTQQKQISVHKLSEVVQVDSLDILWVIDNSGSMGNHQNNVISNTKLFMDSFTQNHSLDWKMGLISTDEDEAPYIGFERGRELDWRTPDPVGTFQNAVSRLGTFGSPTEMTFVPVQKAIASYPSFLRSRAILALIVVTDAPEQSRRPSGRDFLFWLGSLKGNAARVVTYGVIGPRDFGCPSTDDTWDYVGSPYEEVIQGTSGKAYKLCTTDFGAQLSDLGRDLVKRVEKPKIYLTLRPKLGTLKLRHQGKDLPGGPKETGGFWFYDFELNAIVFHDLDFAPGDTEEVEIEMKEDDGFPEV